MIREEINPEMEDKPEMAYGGRVFRDSAVLRLTENLEYLSQAAGEGICFCPVTMDLAGL